jgi:hypothetical protein
MSHTRRFGGATEAAKRIGFVREAGPTSAPKTTMNDFG